MSEGGLMQVRICALLVHHGDAPLAELKLLLERQGMKTRRARTFAEAEPAMTCAATPLVFFTDTVLADATWANVVTLGAERAVPVIVVSRLLDNPLYLDVLEPPFREVNIDFVLKGALLRGR
jgi:hypothetical protein